MSSPAERDYKELIGRLLFLQTGTIPEISWIRLLGANQTHPEIVLTDKQQPNATCLSLFVLETTIFS
jgi:hypothetical protein